MDNLDWRLLIIMGIGMLCGSFVTFYWGYQLKAASEPFNHIWVLALGFLWVGVSLIQKAVNKGSFDKD